MSLLLIHGYAVQLQTWFRRKKNTYADFNIFGSEIRRGVVKLFWWSAPYSISFLKTFWLGSYFKLYWDERKRASSIAVLEKLHQYLLAESTEVIACHSMGCFLLLNYVKKFGLPKSVRKVVFIQSDCNKKDVLDSGILNSTIEFVNVYQPFDISLWVSSLVHGSIRLGLTQLTLPKVTNHYLLSLKDKNLHIAALSDPRLKKFLLQHS